MIDNYEIWAAHDAEMERRQELLPRCERCGEPLDTYLFEIDDEVLCEDCVAAKFRRNVEDYLR